jgi:ParB family chromosome partitioning protein
MMSQANGLVHVPAAGVLTRFEAAKRALAEARTVDEVKQVRDQAKALEEYVKQSRESLEMANDICEIRLRAERKAGEMLAAMEKNQGGNPNLLHAETGSPPTLEELGISRTQSHRWQVEAKVPREVFERHVAEVKSSGEELTSRGLLDLAKSPKVAHNAGEQEWYTPPAFVEAARAVMGRIDLDPASSDVAQRSIKAGTYYTQETDGLSQAWAGRVWLNPPYASGLIQLFVEKLCQHYAAGDVSEAIALTNDAMETAWAQLLARHAAAVCFPSGRIRFLDALGTPGAPLQGQAVFYMGPGPTLFARVFEAFGSIAAWLPAMEGSAIAPNGTSPAIAARGGPEAKV